LEECKTLKVKGVEYQRPFPQKNAIIKNEKQRLTAPLGKDRGAPTLDCWPFCSLFLLGALDR